MAPETRPPGNDRAFPGTVGLIRVFGIPVRLHFTFLLLLAFLLFVGVSRRQSALANVLYVLALFGSVALHELGHALVANRYGIRTLEIVMFPIGGIASPERAPRGREEFWIGIAGPMVNFVLGGSILAWLYFTRGLQPLEVLRDPTDATLWQRIAFGNLLLGAFNLLPAYPMDGGRVLRSLLALRRSEEEATRIAAQAGRFLAVLMGLFGLLSGNFILVFIALFVYLGASQEGALARGISLSSGYTVRNAMVTDFRTLSHGDTIRHAGELLLSTSQHDFPVLHGDQVVGLLTRSALVRAMLTRGPESYVAGAMERNFPRLSPDASLPEAMREFNQTQSSALVMEGDRLAGMVTSENLSEFLLLREAALAQEKLAARMS
ncbi:MAG: site-2 protease family protein [Acidobacteria bacterium]|nr:site-2 protease family protein [Acidobacteriota bacterium]